MRFAFTAEQGELRSLMRDFLSDHDALGQSRAVTDGAALAGDTWLAMARDLGLQGVDIPEAFGGTGMTAVELVLTMEEVGASLYPGPFLATTGLAAGALMEVAAAEESTVACRLLQRVCEGASATLAVSDSPEPWTLATETSAVETPSGGWAITGSKPMVLQADVVDILLLAARTPTGAHVLMSVDPSLATIEPLGGLDGSRQVCRVMLSQTPAQLVGPLSEESVARIRLRAEVCLAGESLGAARRCLDLATAYAGIRVQFGRPVGSFQAVKHRLADLLVDVELATSLVYVAACHLASGDWDAARASAPMALAAASSAQSRAAADSIQLHGGIAFTWEHGAHLFTRRAAVSSALLGSPTKHYADLYGVVAASQH